MARVITRCGFWALIPGPPGKRCTGDQLAGSNGTRSVAHPTGRCDLPPALHQVRGAAVEFVGPLFDVAEHIGDPSQVLKSPATAFHRGRRLRCAVVVGQQNTNCHTP